MSALLPSMFGEATTGGGKAISAARFSPDGSMLASSCACGAMLCA